MATATKYDASEGEQTRVELDDEYLVRQMPFGSTWNKITVGWLLSFESKGANMTLLDMTFGICHTTNPMGVASPNTVLGVQFGNVITPTGNLITERDSSGRKCFRAPGYNVFKVIGGTITSIATAAPATLPAIGEETTYFRRSPILVQYTRSGSDIIVDYWAPADLTDGAIGDVTKGEFMRLLSTYTTNAQRSLRNSSSFAFNFFVRATATSFSEANGALNGVYVSHKDRSTDAAKLYVHGMGAWKHY